MTLAETFRTGEITACGAAEASNVEEPDTPDRGVRPGRRPFRMELFPITGVLIRPQRSGAELESGREQVHILFEGTPGVRPGPQRAVFPAECAQAVPRADEVGLPGTTKPAQITLR